MYQNCCKKCGSVSLHTEVKGSNTGLYCDDCGAWVKWLGKDELRAFEHSMREASKEERESVDKYISSISKPTGFNFFNDETIIENLKDFVEYLDKKIDAEYEKMPISPEDAIRKSAYCLGLQHDKWALENILQGKKWSETE